MWTAREAQKVCVHRLNDAVAIVTHPFSESRAKSALISITSFSGRYCARLRGISGSESSVRSGIDEAAQSLSFDAVGSVRAATFVSSSALLCRLDVRRPLERASGSGGH